MFRYNAQEDRLELCLEPYGHFPVEPNIEQKVQQAGMEGAKEEVKFGASGVIHHGTERRAFGGREVYNCGYKFKTPLTSTQAM